MPDSDIDDKIINIFAKNTEDKGVGGQKSKADLS
jgi:hypothetical protein